MPELATYNWAAFIAYVFASGFTPGPNTIMSMSNGSRHGFKKTIPFLAGIFCGISLISVACGLFCNTLSQLIPKIKTPMLIVGALYILYLAYKMFTSKGDIAEKEPNNTFWYGFTFQFINPKVYLYLIMSQEAYVMPGFQGQIKYVLFFAMFLAVFALFADICWCLFGSAFKALFTKHARIVNIVMGILLIYCAISLFL